MANELPYFRFTVQAWQNGDISLESYELKGLFIDICGYYWVQDCSITLAMLNKKFRNDENIESLIDLGIIKHEKKHDKINIDFLNKQYDLLSEKRKRRQLAGSKGGNAKAKVKQNGSYKDKDKDKDKDKKTEKFNFRKELVSCGFNEELVVSWLEIRKKKKAVNSEIAFKGFIREIEKIKTLPINEILKIVIEKSWSGFEAAWIDKNEKNGEKQTNYDAVKEWGQDFLDSQNKNG